MTGRDNHLFPHQDRGLQLQDPISKGIQAEIAAGSQGNLQAQGLVANITNQEFLGSQRSFQDKFTLVVGGSTPRGSLPKQGGAGQGSTLGINNAALKGALERTLEQFVPGLEGSSRAQRGQWRQELGD